MRNIVENIKAIAFVLGIVSLLAGAVLLLSAFFNAMSLGTVTYTPLRVFWTTILAFALIGNGILHMIMSRVTSCSICFDSAFSCEKNYTNTCECHLRRTTDK